MGCVCQGEDIRLKDQISEIEYLDYLSKFFKSKLNEIKIITTNLTLEEKKHQDKNSKILVEKEDKSLFRFKSLFSSFLGYSKLETMLTDLTFLINAQILTVKESNKFGKNRYSRPILTFDSDYEYVFKEDENYFASNDEILIRKKNNDGEIFKKSHALDKIYDENYNYHKNLKYILIKKINLERLREMKELFSGCLASIDTKRLNYLENRLEELLTTSKDIEIHIYTILKKDRNFES